LAQAILAQAWFFFWRARCQDGAARKLGAAREQLTLPREWIGVAVVTSG